MKTILLVSVLLIFITPLNAQVGIGITTPHQSAALEIKDSTKGILIPRLKMSQRLAMANPAEGLMVYQVDSIRGYWHFNGVTWMHIYSSSSTGNVGGKMKLVLADSITNAEAQAIIASDYGPNTQEICVISCYKLTTLDLSMVKTSTNIFISDNPILQTVNLSNLKTVVGHLYVVNCPVLNSLNLSSLQNIFLGTLAFDFPIYFSLADYALYIAGVKLTNLTLPVLKSVTGNILIEDNFSLTTINFPSLVKVSAYYYVRNNFSLTNLSMPLFESCNIFEIYRNISLPKLSLPSFKSVSTISIRYDNSLTSASFPALERFIPSGTEIESSSVINNCLQLTNLEIGTLVQFTATGLNLNSLKLTTPGINMLLSKFVSITPNISGKTLDFRQSIPAPPSGQGIIDKATLIAHGNTVYTN